MTNLPELISRLRSAVHEESVLISPRTSKLIEEVKYAIGVLEGEAGLPAGEMVERVARAIHESSSRWPWASMSDMNKHDRRKVASAAIEAMREPTEVMVCAWGEAKSDETVSSPLEPEDGYRAMIDAALATGRSPSQPTSKGGVE